MIYKKVFLDANIFLDYSISDRDIEQNAEQVLKYLLQNEIEIFTSCDLITTIYYILSKRSQQEALNSIEHINQFCNIIEFSNKEVNQTCKLMRENKKYKDLEDTIQYILAKKEECDLIISNDTKFASDDIPLMTTKQFLKKVL